jgi:hypothetical protein
MIDIGPGAGKYGSLMRQVEKSQLFRCRKLAVEIDSTYVQQYGLESIYEEIWLRDACNLVTTLPDLVGDLAMMGDVIEHFPKSRGIDLVEYLLYRFRHLIVVFPIDLPQGAWEGHMSEAHVSLWYPDDFLRYRASYCTTVTPEGWTMCLVLMNGVFLKPEERLTFGSGGQGLNIVNGIPSK